MDPAAKIAGEISDLESSLRATEFILMDMGYLEPEEKRKHISVPRPGIRIRGELSFRGKQKAEELFDRLDEDGEGGLTLEAFRSMKSLKFPYESLDRHEFNKNEAWRMYLADCGVPTDHVNAAEPAESPENYSNRRWVGNGLLRKEHLVRHRIDIELEDGLTKDLRNAGLGYLPKKLVCWGEMKTLIEEAFIARKPDSIENPDRLNREDSSFILCNLGLCYSKAEYMWLMIRRARFEIVMDELLGQALRNDLFLSPNRLGGLFCEGRILMPEDELDLPALSTLTPDHLAGWTFSNRPEPTYPVGVHVQWRAPASTNNIICNTVNIPKMFACKVCSDKVT